VGGEAEDRDDDHDVAHHRHQDDQRQHQARAYRLPASRSNVSFNPILHTWIGDRNLTIQEYSFKWVKIMLPYKSGRGLLVVGGWEQCDDSYVLLARAYRLPASRDTVSFNPILHTGIGDSCFTCDGS
jgi:hypothetical protein